jgi:hypothetical protein
VIWVRILDCTGQTGGLWGPIRDSDYRIHVDMMSTRDLIDLILVNKFKIRDCNYPTRALWNRNRDITIHLRTYFGRTHARICQTRACSQGIRSKQCLIRFPMGMRHQAAYCARFAIFIVGPLRSCPCILEVINTPCVYSI